MSERQPFSGRGLHPSPGGCRYHHIHHGLHWVLYKALFASVYGFLDPLAFSSHSVKCGCTPTHQLQIWSNDLTTCFTQRLNGSRPLTFPRFTLCDNAWLHFLASDCWQLLGVNCPSFPLRPTSGDTDKLRCSQLGHGGSFKPRKPLPRAGASYWGPPLTMWTPSQCPWVISSHFQIKVGRLFFSILYPLGVCGHAELTVTGAVLNTCCLWHGDSLGHVWTLGDSGTWLQNSSKVKTRTHETDVFNV